MKAVSVLDTPTQICGPGIRDFIHIYNNSDSYIYLCYDGDATALTVNNGMPLLPNAFMTFDNINRPIYGRAIYGIAAVSGKEVRVQGD